MDVARAAGTVAGAADHRRQVIRRRRRHRFHPSRLVDLLNQRIDELSIGGLRLLALFGRFIITLYIARFIGVADVGLYGYVVGGYTILSAISGLGMNYTMDRDIVNRPLFIAALIIRDRMLARFFMVLAIIGLTYWLVPLPPELRHSVFPPLIVMGETMLFDVQRSIAYRGEQLSANAFLFIRSAAWVPFVVFAGAFFPGLRTMEVVWFGWTASLVASFLALVLHLRNHLSIRRGRGFPIDWRWMETSLNVGKLAYVADIGAVSVGYFDRYYLGSKFGLEAAGAYVFFWSFTNAIVSLVQASHFQLVFPQLVAFGAAGDATRWRAALARAIRDIIFTSSVLGIGIYVLLGSLDTKLRAGNTSQDLALLALMLIGTVVKLTADMLHDALHSARRDRACLIIYTCAAIVSPCLTVILISIFGLIGAGVQMIVTNLIMLAARAAVLRWGGRITMGAKAVTLDQGAGVSPVEPLSET